MHTRVPIWGSVLLVAASACSGAGDAIPGSGLPSDGGIASRESGASAPPDSGSYATGTGARSSGSGGASAGGDTTTGGTTGTGGNTSVGGTTGSGGASSQCLADLQTVENDFLMAGRNADLSCTNDGQCVEGPTPACDSFCVAPVVSKRGASLLQASLIATAAACARVSTQGCSRAPVPCEPVLGTPACVTGVCKRFIPVAWSSVSFAEAPSRDVECDSAGACEEWTIYPDGRVTDALPGAAPRMAMLVPGDIERVTVIVESVAFRQAFFTPLSCTPAASPHPPITVARRDPSGNRYEQAVQDCIYGGPEDNDPRTLWNIAHDAYAADAGP